MPASNERRDQPADETRTVQSRQPVARTPHERDQSADSQAAGNADARKVGRIAHDDLKDGLVDTDKGPVMDAVYDKVLEKADREPKL